MIELTFALVDDEVVTFSTECVILREETVQVE